MIRPLDLQNAILTSMQNAPAVQRAEDAPRQAALAAQAAFVNEVTEREETVAATAEATGNRVDAKPDKQREDASRKRRRKPTGTFEDVVEDAAGSADEPEHLIDFTA